MKLPLTFTLNGQETTVLVSPDWSLLRLLRDELELTGTKEGCGAGECGACTVLVDGRPAPSCLVLASSCEGREVVTVEGLAPSPGALHPFQQALVEGGGVQCGFCTPGVAVTGAAALDRGVGDREEGARLLSGNLCRCTGYAKILDALEAAAEGSRGPE